MKKKGILSKIRITSIIYDENLDILEFHTNHKTHHCIELADLFIIHCNEKNKIIGLELLNLSKIYNIDKTTLNNLKF